jgi:hypothetical protein
MLTREQVERVAGSKVIAYAEQAGELVAVLERGPKLRFSAEQITRALVTAAPAGAAKAVTNPGELVTAAPPAAAKAVTKPGKAQKAKR